MAGKIKLNKTAVITIANSKGGSGKSTTASMLARTLGEKGGFVGVNFCSAFLREGSNHASIDDIVRHTVYMADKAGIESVGMGSDFDGIDNTLEMKDYAGYPLVMDALSKHFTQSEIDMICSRNIMRVIRETMK